MVNAKVQLVRARPGKDTAAARNTMRVAAIDAAPWESIGQVCAHIETDRGAFSINDDARGGDIRATIKLQAKMASNLFAVRHIKGVIAIGFRLTRKVKAAEAVKDANAV